MRESALRVCLELSTVLLSQYPGMRSVLRSEIETILNDMTAVALVKLEDGLLREQVVFIYLYSILPVLCVGITCPPSI